MNDHPIPSVESQKIQDHVDRAWLRDSVREAVLAGEVDDAVRERWVQLEAEDKDRYYREHPEEVVG